ncbi:hypothetical protein [Kribbella deserti]|uniref:Uncharacterized protein n=1 Tax=Kribbella deserti TaxID=1926257 RepID=A0ABV6QG27_9ACTN
MKTTQLVTLWIAAALMVAGGATTAVAVAGGENGTTVLTSADITKRLATSASPAAPPRKAAVGTWTLIESPMATIKLRCDKSVVTDYRAIVKSGWSRSVADDKVQWATHPDGHGLQVYIGFRGPGQRAIWIGRCQNSAGQQGPIYSHTSPMKPNPTSTR